MLFSSPRRIPRCWAGLAFFACALNLHAEDVNFGRLLNAHTTPQDWLTHHGTYRSWHYSALDQINLDNVAQLKVAWLHTPARASLPAAPLVADGVLYYISAEHEVWALDATDGSRLWRYDPALESLPGDNPGLALAGNKLLFAAGGDIFALEAKTGALAWRQTLLGARSKYRLAGAPLVVKDKAIVGAHSAGGAGCCGPIFAVNTQTGAKVWQFDTVAATAKTPDSENADNVGGGAWLTGSYDFDSNTVWIGTAAPAPRLDWAGGEWRREGARPGENLFTSSVVALDADSGKLVRYFQEVPHDVWGFDAAGGEHILFERDGKRYALHPNKSGFVYLYARDLAAQPHAQLLSLASIWRLSKYSNFVHSIDTNTGALIGRRDLPVGKHLNVCPSSDGAIGGGAGALSPRTGMYYKVVREWCSNIELTQFANADATQPPQLSSTWQLAHPPGRTAFGHLSARDPVTGALVWEREYPQPPAAGLLTTAGNLLFVPHVDGRLEALDARNGRTLWTHNNGAAHEGSVITYAVNGKQYLAVTTGWSAATASSYAKLWGEPFASMPADAGQVIVFALP
jgi:PQQ-dependent dehydrogenase (methanol/ethanol family)